jgi:hypothetical protein
MKPQSQQPQIQEVAELRLREQGVQPCCRSSWPMGLRGGGQLDD